MRHFTLLACLLVSIIVSAQYTEPGFYRVHNVNSDGYISIKGTHFEKATTPDAFWPCVLMVKDSTIYSDPGTIIYIPGTDQVGLHAQGVSTYTLTGLLLDVLPAPVMEGDRDTYVARTQYENLICYFRDQGSGMTAGGSNRRAESHWWIEPVSESSMDNSYLGLKPVTEDTINSDIWYWATMCCDYPIYIPTEGGVEGAYTICEITMGIDSLYYAEPVKVYGQGDTVPAATPILFKCASPYASANKVLPVGEIANQDVMPITNDMLMGNYFSSFTNLCNLLDFTETKVYIPEQATPASLHYLALGTDAEGNPTFMPKKEGSYMDANSAWLVLNDLPTKGIVSVRLGTPPEEEEEPIPVSGDIDGDDDIDISDLTDLLAYVLNNTSEDYNQVYDIDGNGTIDVNDVTYLIYLLLDSDE